MKDKKTNYIMLFVYIALALAALFMIFYFSVKKQPDQPLKVAFITSGSIDAEGWNSTNYRCITQACENTGTELLTVSGIDNSTEQCLPAVESVVNNGAEIVFLNSYLLANSVRDYLANYPDVLFYGAGADFETGNFSSFSGRMYQARYLSGIVAGYYSQTGKIGFVAANKDISTIRGLNAFTLGVRKVNPDAEVVVVWTESWENEEKEKAAAIALIENEKVDLLAYHQNKSYVVETAEKYGIASIGYYDPPENHSDKYLTCAMCDWTKVYEKMIDDYISGQGNSSRSEWLGIESGTILLTELSPLVSEEAREAVNEEKQHIIDGSHIFSGEIYDNTGTLRCEEGENISDDTLLYEMDWFVEGVREYAE